ncbi:MAG: aldolase/citrate lyase family protein [Pseudomonadota bacterium]
MSPTPREKLDRLMANVPARGCWLGLPSIVTAEIMGRAGFDFAIADLEHGPSSVETAMGQLIALAGTPTVPVVRVPQGGGPWIKRALDIGAQVVIVPAVESPEEAVAHVAAFRYGPAGRRGCAARIVRASGYGADDDYVAEWNDTGLLICQIESPEALERAEEIARVDGVDGLFFGPADFATIAGFPGDGELEAAFDRMCVAARKLGKLTGTVPFARLTAADLVRAKVDIVAVASDISILRKGAQAVLDDAASGF